MRAAGLTLLSFSLFSCGGEPTSLGEALGERILFSRGYGITEEIFVVRPDGSGRHQLTSNEVWDGQPHLAPDGRHIVFASTRDSVPHPFTLQGSEIYVMDFGGSPRKLTEGDGIAQMPRWSPDGTRIAFQRYDPIAVRQRVYVMNADGSNVRVLITDSTASDFAPDWSPDGTKILYLSQRVPGEDWGMYIMNADGTNAQMLGGNGACAGSVYEARWSPDGERIAYSCASGQDLAIYTIQANGTGVTRISRPDPQTGRNIDFSPVWSPDGSRIAFTSEGPPDEYSTYDLYVMTLDGTRSRLTNDETWDLASDWGRPR